MLSLEQFERLVAAPINKKAGSLTTLGGLGERLEAWATNLPLLDKHIQYRQIKAVLGELVFADMADDAKIKILERIFIANERLVNQMRQTYVHTPQSPLAEQKACVDEVRSLYFLLILAYQGIAFDAHDKLNQENGGDLSKKSGLLSRLTGSLSVNVARNGIAIDVVGEPRKLFILSVYRLMGLCHQLMMEFAFTYQKTPKSLWRLMNGWYLKAAVLGVDKQCVSKLFGLSEGCIYQQYTESCMASLVNLFAYRRADIISIFKIAPTWASHIKTTFTAHEDLKLFVNLQADTPPELITPYASINPYSKDYVCLFFDIAPLIAHINSTMNSEQAPSAFEMRLANIAMTALEHHSMDMSAPRPKQQSAQMLSGFGNIFRQIAEGKAFYQVIAQSQLAEVYHPKRVLEASDDVHTESVRLLRKSEAGVQFVLSGEGQDGHVSMLTRPYLPAFGLFALKSLQSTNKHPWRLGIVHWVQPCDEHIEVEGRFLGRLLSVCGVRLSGRDPRSKDFVQALLVAGDSLNMRTTMVLPRYHFKAGDTVVLRVDTKETTLRLEQNILTTDDIEQYQIVRLAGH